MRTELVILPYHKCPKQMNNRIIFNRKLQLYKCLEKFAPLECADAISRRCTQVITRARMRRNTRRPMKPLSCRLYSLFIFCSRATIARGSKGVTAAMNRGRKYIRNRGLRRKRPHLRPDIRECHLQASFSGVVVSH